jgi:hypothetical protein
VTRRKSPDTIEANRALSSSVKAKFNVETKPLSDVVYQVLKRQSGIMKGFAQALLAIVGQTGCWDQVQIFSKLRSCDASIAQMTISRERDNLLYRPTFQLMWGLRPDVLQRH